MLKPYPGIFVAVLLAASGFAAEAQSAAQASVPTVAAGSDSERPATSSSPLDPREIVRRSVEVDHHNWERARNYTCTQREVEKQVGKHGEVKSTNIKTYDVNFYYGQLYTRLIQKNDQPLSEAEQKKEDEKLEKFLAKLRDQTEQEREKRINKEKKEHEEERAFLRDVVNAYDFRLLGSEIVNGADTWVVEATPRKDFHPTQPHADILAKVKGRIWIEKSDYNWVKAEAESIDTISFGLFLFRIHKGARLSFDQVHLNDEVWLVRRFYVSGGARLALLKNMAIEQEDEFSNYQKYSASTRILPGVREAPADTPK